MGLGKTHLAQAIGNEVKRLNNNKVVLYVSSEKFINQFSYNIHTKFSLLAWYSILPLGNLKNLKRKYNDFIINKF